MPLSKSINNNIMFKILENQMKNIFKLMAMPIMAFSSILALAGCDTDADVASRNISQAADNFEVPRRIVFLNGITDKYILVVEGLCSIGQGQMNKELMVTCKTGPGQFVKHLLGLSDNVTFFAEQLQSVNASTNYYRVVFKPEEIIPDIRIK